MATNMPVGVRPRGSIKISDKTSKRIQRIPFEQPNYDFIKLPDFGNPVPWAVAVSRQPKP